jgi:hypothetical protein
MLPPLPPWHFDVQVTFAFLQLQLVFFEQSVTHWHEVTFGLSFAPPR